MPLNIKDAETDPLARQLAAETGESITVALRTAAEERLGRIRVPKRRTEVGPGLQAYIDRARARAVLDDRTPEELIGYDDHGLPT